MRIKSKVLEKLAADNRVKADLCEALGRSLFSIQRYVNDNNDELTKESALRVIREAYGLTNDQILEETSKTAA